MTDLERTRLRVCPDCGYTEAAEPLDPPWEDDYPRTDEEVATVGLGNAIDTIILSWERWEDEAGQAAQQEQHPDAYLDVMRGHLLSVLRGLAGNPKPPTNGEQS